MQIGCHVSISGSIHHAVDNALERKCSAFQIFTRSPRSWQVKKLTNDDIKNFKTKLNDSKIDRFATVAHMPYLPNLSSPANDAYAKSINALKEEVKRCGELGIPYLVTHLGSHLGTGEEKGIERLRNGLMEAAKIKNDVTILLENTAGQKNSVGSNFEQFASIFFSLKPSHRFGICFDKFDKAVGLDHLKIMHLNDSKGKIGCKLDRHYHIGLGHIGEKGLSKVV